MPKQTSIQWFLNRFEELEYNRINRKNSWADSVKHLEMIKEKAKQMHKEEIIDAYETGDKYKLEIAGEKWFAETYGSKVSDEHIVETNEMIDHIGDANKMVEAEEKPMRYHCVPKEISDEEIEKWVASTPYYGHCTPEYKEGLDEGAKWYREQLKGGNNES